jgi:hypothetical protein
MGFRARRREAAEGPGRVMQTAASLSEGTIQLLETGNRYAASALIRQLIEIEYLLWLFRIDSTAAADWLTITDEKGRSRFRPGSMRRRSGKRFQAGEYHTHCEMGGHPHPRGGGLLPERYFANAESEARLVELLWLDFAIHLDRAWREYELTRHAFGLKQIVVASDAVEAMRVAYREWYAADPLGRDAVEGRKLHSATTSAPAG